LFLVGVIFDVSGVLTPLMVLPGVCNSSGRRSVANRLLRFLTSPGNSVTY